MINILYDRIYFHNDMTHHTNLVEKYSTDIYHSSPSEGSVSQ